MTYTPADPYTPFFPGATTTKPDNITQGQDILFEHVGPLWDEVVATQNVLGGVAGAALIIAASGTGAVPLTLKGFSSGQTADIFRVRTSSNTNLFQIGPDGKASVSGRVAITSAGEVLGSYLISTDAQPAFKISNDGTASWGAGGSSATDTNLYRNSSGVLRTDNRLIVGGNITPLTLTGTGVNLATTGAIDITQSSPGSTKAFAISGVNDSQYRFFVDSRGYLSWSSGASTLDVSLYRNGFGSLTLSGSLIISNTLTVNGKTPVYTDNLALTDSRPPTGTASGDLSGTYPAPTIKSDVLLPGAPTTATAAIDTNTTQLATTQFVIGQASSSSPLSTSILSAIGTSTRFARADHVHTIGNDSVTLGTHTTGNYVATVTGPTGSLSISGSGSETANVSIDLATLTGPTGTYTSVTIDNKGRVTSGSNPTYVTSVTGPNPRIVVSTTTTGPTGAGVVTVDLATTNTGPTGPFTSVSIDQYGRTTSGTLQPVVTSVTGPSGRLAFSVSGPTIANVATLDLASGIVTTGTYASVTVDTYGRVTSGTNPVYVANVTGPSTSFTFTTGPSGPTGSVLTTIDLATLTGPTGTYNSVTIDNKGRVIGASNVTAAANTVFAGPTGGSSATATFRSVVVADIADLPPHPFMLMGA